MHIQLYTSGWYGLAKNRSSYTSQFASRGKVKGGRIGLLRGNPGDVFFFLVATRAHSAAAGASERIWTMQRDYRFARYRAQGGMYSD